jgi:hypothetical protein
MLLRASMCGVASTFAARATDRLRAQQYRQEEVGALKRHSGLVCSPGVVGKPGEMAARIVTKRRTGDDLFGQSATVTPVLNQPTTPFVKRPTPRETLLLLATDSASQMDFSSADLLTGEGTQVVIAAGFPLAPSARLAWEQRGYRVIESRGGSREDLCAIGMAAAEGHVVRVRSLSEVLVVREVALETREAVRPQ